MHSVREALEDVFVAYRSRRMDGDGLAEEDLPEEALFYKAMLHLTEGQEGACRSILMKLRERGAKRGLVAEIARWSAERPDASANAAVYASPEGFESFIKNGSNLALYKAVRAELTKIYAGYPELRLLDIGIGTGFAQDGALSETVAELVALDPSPRMLEQALRHLAAPGRSIRSVEGSVEAFLAREPEGRWPLAVATFSMNCLSSETRAKVLTALARRVSLLVIAEFDVPELGEAWGPSRHVHLRERYEIGVAEYLSIGEAAAVNGFLIPMFLGHYAPGAVQQNHEQPLATWQEDCKAAGFRRVEAKSLYPYWWAEGFLITAYA